MIMFELDLTLKNKYFLRLLNVFQKQQRTGKHIYAIYRYIPCVRVYIHLCVLTCVIFSFLFFFFLLATQHVGS